jgi:hypothetical protein
VWQSDFRCRPHGFRSYERNFVRAGSNSRAMLSTVNGRRIVSFRLSITIRPSRVDGQADPQSGSRPRPSQWRSVRRHCKSNAEHERLVRRQPGRSSAGFAAVYREFAIAAADDGSRLTPEELHLVQSEADGLGAQVNFLSLTQKQRQQFEGPTAAEEAEVLRGGRLDGSTRRPAWRISR